MTSYLGELISQVPVNRNEASFDLEGIDEAMLKAEVSPDAVLAVSHAKFGTAPIAAQVDDDTLIFVHPAGVLCTTGKRKLLSGSVKSKAVSFRQCRVFGPVEHADDRGFGTYGIEFAGPGNILLGRLSWSWRAKRFRDASTEIMKVAEERDRVLGVVARLVG